MRQASTVLQRDFELGFNYTRTTGPIVGRFLSGLRDRKVFGIRSSKGAVLVPPMEFDPETAAPLTEFVEVGQQGTVRTWCWVGQPREKHPMKDSFAWALVQLDGAESAMLHCVAARSADAMKTGMRVRVRWAEQPRGHITDIACFEAI